MCGRGLMQHVTQQGQVCEIYELYNDAFAASKPYEVIDRWSRLLQMVLHCVLHCTLHYICMDAT